MCINLLRDPFPEGNRRNRQAFGVGLVHHVDAADLTLERNHVFGASAAFFLVDRLALGAIFLWTGLLKLRATDQAGAILNYGLVSPRIAGALAVVLAPSGIV